MSSSSSAMADSFSVLAALVFAVGTCHDTLSMDLILLPVTFTITSFGPFFSGLFRCITTGFCGLPTTMWGALGRKEGRRVGLGDLEGEGGFGTCLDLRIGLGG